MTKYPVGATGATFEILEALADEDGAGVTALANELGRSKGSVHDHLSTLERLDYVVKDDGKYRVGLKFLELAGGVRAREPLFRAGREEVERLASSSGETASLAVEEDGEAVFVHRAGDDLENPIRTGSRVPLHSCAAGKAILANRRDSAVELSLQNEGANAGDRTASDRESLQSELQTVRDQGLAFDRGELDADRRAVAAPIADGDGHTVGALAVSGPAERMSGKRLEEDMPGLVISNANAISVALAKE